MALTRTHYNKIVEVSSCWFWIGAINQSGYGNLGVNGRTYSAHRWFYEHLRHRVESPLELDHLCHNRSCVNPDHLEPVDHTTNIQRAIRKPTIHCPYGHIYTEENTYLTKRGYKQCRSCILAKQRKRYHERKQRQ